AVGAQLARGRRGRAHAGKPERALLRPRDPGRSEDPDPPRLSQEMEGGGWHLLRRGERRLARGGPEGYRARPSSVQDRAGSLACLIPDTRALAAPALASARSNRPGSQAVWVRRPAPGPPSPPER